MQLCCGRKFRHNHEKVNINLLHDEDIQIVDVDGKDVVSVNVPRAHYTTRPVS